MAEHYRVRTRALDLEGNVIPNGNPGGWSNHSWYGGLWDFDDGTKTWRAERSTSGSFSVNFSTKIVRTQVGPRPQQKFHSDTLGSWNHRKTEYVIEATNPHSTYHFHFDAS